MRSDALPNPRDDPNRSGLRTIGENVNLLPFQAKDGLGKTARTRQDNPSGTQEAKGLGIERANTSYANKHRQLDLLLYDPLSDTTVNNPPPTTTTVGDSRTRESMKSLRTIVEKNPKQAPKSGAEPAPGSRSIIKEYEGWHKQYSHPGRREEEYCAQARSEQQEFPHAGTIITTTSRLEQTDYQSKTVKSGGTETETADYMITKHPDDPNWEITMFNVARSITKTDGKQIYESFGRIDSSRYPHKDRNLYGRFERVREWQRTTTKPGRSPTTEQAEEGQDTYDFDGQRTELERTNYSRTFKTSEGEQIEQAKKIKIFEPTTGDSWEASGFKRHTRFAGGTEIKEEADFKKVRQSPTGTTWSIEAKNLAKEQKLADGTLVTEKSKTFDFSVTGYPETTSTKRTGYSKVSRLQDGTKITETADSYNSNKDSNGSTNTYTNLVRVTEKGDTKTTESYKHVSEQIDRDGKKVTSFSQCERTVEQGSKLYIELLSPYIRNDDAKGQLLSTATLYPADANKDNKSYLMEYAEQKLVRDTGSAAEEAQKLQGELAQEFGINFDHKLANVRPGTYMELSALKSVLKELNKGQRPANILFFDGPRLAEPISFHVPSRTLYVQLPMYLDGTVMNHSKQITAQLKAVLSKNQN